MTEKHYAHLSPSYVAETIRANFPNLGIVEKTNVASITKKRLNPHSPDEHMSCKWVRIDSDIGISSLYRWIGDNHGAPCG